MDKVSPDIDKPTGVTHFICPAGPTKNGAPDAEHHMVPMYDSRRAGVMRCTYCGETETALRRRNRL